MQAFLATVMGWAPNFSPRDWAFCHGQLIAIAQANALFSLLGTIYGGDGRTTFALPDLRGRALIGQGLAPGLQPYVLGMRGGQEFVTLNIPELPAHTHTAALTGGAVTITATTTEADTNIPAAGALFGTAKAGVGLGAQDARIYSTTGAANVALSSASVSGTVTVGITGNSSSHENRHPYQVLNWIIALEGLYPSRN